MNKFFNETISNELMSLWATEIEELSENKKSNIIKIINDVENMYNAEGRYYHNANHIKYMIKNYRDLFAKDMLPYQHKVIMTSIIFHDVVYFPWSGYNEVVSFEYAWQFLDCVLNRRLHLEFFDEVRQTILATKHCFYAPDYLNYVPFYSTSKHLQIIRDLDLLHFTDMDTPELRKEIINNLRFENYLMDDRVFVESRIKFLEDVLSKENIYWTDEIAKFETIARENIENQINELKLMLGN